MCLTKLHLTIESLTCPRQANEIEFRLTVKIRNKLRSLWSCKMHKSGNFIVKYIVTKSMNFIDEITRQVALVEYSLPKHISSWSIIVLSECDSRSTKQDIHVTSWKRRARQIMSVSTFLVQRYLTRRSQLFVDKKLTILWVILNSVESRLTCSSVDVDV